MNYPCYRDPNNVVECGLCGDGDTTPWEGCKYGKEYDAFYQRIAELEKRNSELEQQNAALEVKCADALMDCGRMLEALNLYRQEYNALYEEFDWAILEGSISFDRLEKLDKLIGELAPKYGPKA